MVVKAVLHLRAWEFYLLDLGNTGRLVGRLRTFVAACLIDFRATISDRVRRRSVSEQRTPTAVADLPDPANVKAVFARFTSPH